MGRLRVTSMTGLRIGGAVALVVTCGCASTEPGTPLSTHPDYNNAVQLAELAGDAGSNDTSMADASGSRDTTGLAGSTETTTAVETEHAADADRRQSAGAAGERRTAPGRRLTTRQKRIFVLGLAAREKK